MKGSGYVILWFLVGVISLSANIWGYSVYILDEAKNAECAREMLETGDWIVPTFNYTLRTDKPPLHYYFMTIAYSVFGVNEFAARFFSVVFGLLTLFSVYVFTRLHLGVKTANYTLMVLVSSLGFIIQFHLAVPDPYLVFFMTVSVLTFYHGHVLKKPAWLYLASSCMGLAVMTKGPVGLVLPAMGIAIFLAYKRRLGPAKLVSSEFLISGLVFLIVTVPWYWFVYHQTGGDWWNSFILEHNFERFLSPKEGHGGLFLIPPLYLLLMTLPLGLFIFPALRSLWGVEKHDLIILSLAMIMIVLIIFSISATKLPNYVSPALPFMAIVVGRYLSTDPSPRIGHKIIFLVYLVVTLAMLSIGLFTNIEPVAENGLWLFGFLSVGGFWGIAFAWKNDLDKAILSVSTTFIFVMVLAFYIIVPALDRQNPVQQTIKEIQVHNSIAAFHIFNPSFSFYLKRPIHVFNEVTRLKEFLESNDDVIVITRKNALPALKPLNLDTVNISADLFERTSTAVLKERK